MPPAVWYLALFLVVIGVPALWPILLLWMRRSSWISQHVPHPNSRAWDDVFGMQRTYWVIVHLKDGRRIGGVYSTNSFASSNPAQPEIYIEEVWNLDDTGKFVDPVQLTAGILILGDECLGWSSFSIMIKGSYANKEA